MDQATGHCDSQTTPRYESASIPELAPNSPTTSPRQETVRTTPRLKELKEWEDILGYPIFF